MGDLISMRTESDCLRCCLAMALDLPYEDVPDFVAEHPFKWADSMVLWLKARSVNVVRVQVVGDGELLPSLFGHTGGAWIASGPAVRGHNHAVLYHGTEMVHDPHPSMAGLEQITAVTVLIKDVAIVERERDDARRRLARSGAAAMAAAGSAGRRDHVWDPPAGPHVWAAIEWEDSVADSLFPLPKVVFDANGEELHQLPSVLEGRVLQGSKVLPDCSAKSFAYAHAALKRAGIHDPGPLDRKIDDLADMYKRACEQRDEYWKRLCKCLGDLADARKGESPSRATPEQQHIDALVGLGWIFKQVTLPPLSPDSQDVRVVRQLQHIDEPDGTPGVQSGHGT